VTGIPRIGLDLRKERCGLVVAPLADVAPAKLTTRERAPQASPVCAQQEKLSVKSPVACSVSPRTMASIPLDVRAQARGHAASASAGVSGA
jgi:hypothetical protein